jgi:hypothetical protein
MGPPLNNALRKALRFLPPSKGLTPAVSLQPDVWRTLDGDHINVLAAAAEIELDRLQAETAAKR